VVAAPGQALPPLPPGIRVAYDEREDRGPLQGLLAGLEALAGTAEAVYATSCDVPFLAPAFVLEMVRRLEDYDAAAPVDDSFQHPLAAVYRPRVLPHIRMLLAADQLRPAFLFDRVRTCRVPVTELTRVDPHLATLRNLNHPAEYLRALKDAGFEPDPAVLAALQTPHT
jgi:molybdenum cofactor guanylyltransferase